MSRAVTCSDGVRRRLLPVPLLVWIGCLAASPPPREWSQERGDEAHTASVAVEPVRAAPVVAWRRPLDLLPGVEPVVSGGVLFVVSKGSGSRRLHAIRILTGEDAAPSRDLGRARKGVRLLAWNGTVVAAEPGRYRGFPLRGGRFGLGWSRRVPGIGGRPCLSGGILYAVAGTTLRRIDARTGRLLGKGRPFAALGGVALAPDGPAIAGVGIEAGAARLLRLGLGADGALSGPGGERERIGLVGESHGEPAFSLTRLSGGGDDPASWFIAAAGVSLRGEVGTFEACVYGGPSNRGGLLPIVTPPAVHDGLAYGFDGGGALLAVNARGQYRLVVAGDRLPRGAGLVGASCAGDVLYLGSWALEIKSGRVLWSLPDLDPAMAAVPAGDRRLVVVTASGDLVCLADPGVAAAEEGPEAPLPPPPLPGEIPAGSDEGEVLAAWQGALRARYARALDDLFTLYASRRLVSESRRVLAEARRYGLAAGRAEALERRIAGKAEHTNADRIARRMAPREREVRRAAYEEHLAGAERCRGAGLPGAAAVLASDAAQILPGDARAGALLRASIPDAFPWGEEPDPGARWSVWAREIVPAGGRFLGADDPAWKRLGGPPFPPPWGGGAIGIRTRHLLCFSLEDDPAVVGAALRNGEGAIRALEFFFAQDAPAAPAEPLEIRIFRDRETYLAARKGRGEDASFQWSGGYYSPAENVSRFFIPRSEESGETLGRSLYKIVAHELTHHYIDRFVVDRRDRGRTRTDLPGFWVVEGTARFIEDQAVETDRRGMRFDDDTVSSLDATVDLDARGKILPPHEIVDMTYEAFTKLDPDPGVKLRLLHTLGTFKISRLGIYYEEAGSLVFFLLNRRGEAGRRALLEYLRDFHRGRTGKGGAGWKRLGFRDAADLDREFRAFLASLRPGPASPK